MISTPAQYLIRFDDLCPTMRSDRFERLLSIIDRYGVRPILAIVPDNQDPELRVQEADPNFWKRMQSLEAAGATIAMHGYRHRCSSRGESILGLHDESEFAGVEESQQRMWIRTGISILRDHGLCPRLFVAPRHGFDHATLRALWREGLGVLSDGFARRTFTRHDVVWIPQQLWEPVTKKSGLWTICLHPNTSSEPLERKIDRFLDHNAAQVTSFDKVIADGQPKALSRVERIVEALFNLRVRVSSGPRHQTTLQN